MAFVFKQFGNIVKLITPSAVAIKRSPAASGFNIAFIWISATSLTSTIPIVKVGVYSRLPSKMPETAISSEAEVIPPIAGPNIPTGLTTDNSSPFPSFQ